MDHIFTVKYIRDERELGEEAEKSSRNGLTCLTPALLPETEEAHPTYLKKG